MATQEITCWAAMRIAVTRVMQGTVAVMAGTFAVTMFSAAPIPAVGAGVIAVGSTVMAMAGSCPLSWAASRSVRRETLIHNYPDARDLVDVAAHAARKEP